MNLFVYLCNIKVTGAFQDLESLMQNAQQLVTLAEKFAISQSRNNTQTTTNNPRPAGGIGEQLDSDSQVIDESVKFSNLLSNIGISNPVTKETAGNQYSRELAIELARVMGPPLEQMGGVLTLTDAYCIFNRARGTELISPEDLLTACTEFPRLQIPLSIRTFPSGVRVIQSSQHNDEALAQRVLKVLGGQESGSVTTEILAKELQLSLILAKQHLLNCEEQGLLCRDQTIEGVRFYNNRFAEWVM